MTCEWSSKTLLITLLSWKRVSAGQNTNNHTHSLPRDPSELTNDGQWNKWNSIILRLCLSKWGTTSHLASLVWRIHTRDGTSPCDLLLQLGDAGYIKHHSKVNGGLLPVLVQLLFQRLLQVNPSLLVLLVEVPQAEICYLTGRQRTSKRYGWRKAWCWTKYSCWVRRWSSAVWYMIKYEYYWG